MLLSVYVVVSLCCCQSMLLSIDVVVSLCCCQSMLLSVYVVVSLCCCRSIFCQSILLSVYVFISLSEQVFSHHCTYNVAISKYAVLNDRSQQNKQKNKRKKAGK